MWIVCVCVCVCLWRALWTEALEEAVPHRYRFQKAVLFYIFVCFLYLYSKKKNQLNTAKNSKQKIKMGATIYKVGKDRYCEGLMN